MKKLLYLLILMGMFGFSSAFGQAYVTPEVQSNGFSLKKQVSNTSMPSGVVFTYTIFYTIPAGATNVVISDNIPASLVIDNVVPGSGCGTPVVAVSGNNITYTIASVSSGCSGTFQVNVHFPPGVTCPQTVARNQVCMQATNLAKFCTEFVSTTATANNPFVVSKGVTGLSWNPQNNGCQYIMAAGDTVMYNLTVHKTSPYQGNDDGQINLNNAVVTDVLPAGAMLVSSTCGATQSGNTITWTVGNLNAANPWLWQTCQIKVKYPAGTFPAGTQIMNTATLSGTNVCNAAYSNTSNTTCIQVAAPVSQGSFNKSVYLPNKMPGCKGTYYITTCNNGNTNLTYNIADVLPTNVTVNSVQFFATAPVTASATLANSTVSTIASSATGSVNWTAPGGSPVASINLSQAGLAPGACLQIQISFTINASVAPNTTITNCANLTSTQIPNAQSCVSFVTAAPAPDLCLFKQICNPQIGYQPGNIFRYRLRVQNIGSLTANFNLSDVLHPSLTYVGNQTAYASTNFDPTCSPSSGTTPWSVPTPSLAGNTLTWTGLSITPECQDFYYTNCGYYGTQGVTFYFIEFDVQVAADAASGVVPNTFTAQGGNLPTPETANTVYTVINVTHGTELTKELSTNNSTWASSGIVTPGGPLYYRLGITNTGTGPLYDVRKVDLLPMNDGANDWLILNRSTTRGSQIGVSNPTGFTYANIATPVPSPVAGTMAGNNLKVLASLGVNIGTTPDAWPFTGSGNNVGIQYGNTYALVSGGTLRSTFQTTVSPNAQAPQKICNDFGARGTGKYIINNAITFTPLTAAASGVVCAEVKQGEDCCEKTKVTKIQDKCCIDIRTECPVKQLSVSVQGGVMSTAAWNCTAGLGAYANQSNFNFTPGGCAPTMNLCFTPDPSNTSGLISVNVVFYFTNGQVCEKSIKFECPQKQVPSDCCGDWTLAFKSSHFKKVGTFKYINPSTTKQICSVDIIAAPGLSAGNYRYDTYPWASMTSTTNIAFTPPATNFVEFWMSSSISYNSNIQLKVNYCDGTYCLDTLKWKGFIIDTEVPTQALPIAKKLVGVKLQVPTNIRLNREVAAIAIALNNAKTPNAYIFAASSGMLPGEKLAAGQACTWETSMSATTVYASLPTGNDAILCGEALSKGLNLVIALPEDSKELPTLDIIYFDKEGDAIAASTLKDLSSEVINTAITHNAVDKNGFLQVSLSPNPASDYAVLAYQIQNTREVQINLFDSTGKLVYTLEKTVKPAGKHTLDIGADLLESGMYYIQLISEGHIETQRLVIVR